MKPDILFDRDREWADLETFIRRPAPAIGLVYGRRRQGKSYVLRSFSTLTGGLYHQALEEEREPALTRIGRLIAADAGVSGTITYPDWVAAFDELIRRAGPDRLVVLDEFPYLIAKSPELPSVIQAAFDAARSAAGPPFRLVLCGSALSVMTDLLSGQKALRGRVSLDTLMAPFDFRQAADYWGITDPGTAFLVNAVLGGTPGYRPLLSDAAPQTPDEFETWLIEGMLDPSSALFREADYVLTEDPAITDRALYQSVLAAIAEGNTTRTGIGKVLARDDSALRYPLKVLEDASFIRRDDDLWRAKRPVVRLVDPYLRFHFAVVRRDLARFEDRRTAEAWADARATFESSVLGPHFEEMARIWTRQFAGETTLGGRPSVVGSTQINDAAARSMAELDVVAVEGNPNAKRPKVLAVGEAKGGSAKRTTGDLKKLEKSRTLLAGRCDAARARLILFGRSGFSPDLVAEAAGRPDLELVDLARIYTGS
ncbi:MAG: ATP-binding protein [Chloroflexota bacterium]